MFAGQDIVDFRWLGGHFTGHVFDPAQAANTWEPNSHTRGIVITTTGGGRSENLTFRDVTSKDVAGAVITVQGTVAQGNDRDVMNFARNVSIDNGVLIRSGKFM